jgi:hypothetical protein
MKNFVTLLILIFNLNLLQAGIPTSTVEYYGPTEMLLARESKEKIQSFLLKQKVSNDLMPFLDSISAEETWGHIGYHGANHNFRFYQDVIKFTIEEILAIPIREDFHFLRVPGDPDLNLHSINKFMDFWGEGQIDNRDEMRTKQLLSLNYSIYSNFEIPGCCSASLFARDASALHVDYVKELEPFYDNLGINTKKLQRLKALFEERLTDSSGILLQISEGSHLHHSNQEAYNFADKQCYPSIRGGYRYDNNLISVHYQIAMTFDYVNKSANISDQLRLLLNTRHTLNPYSDLKIKRWDLQDPKKIQAYENLMRDMIRNFKFDRKKVANYRQLLMRKWKQLN